MLKKTITFRDLDDNLITEDFYFNLSKAELAEMELSVRGGMKTYLESIIESEDGVKIIAAYKDILKRAYGRRSADNRSFVKTEEGWAEFEGTDAYSQLFIELVTNAKTSAEFIAGIMPKELAEQAGLTAQAIENSKVEFGTRNSADDYSRQELLDMPQEQFTALVGNDPTKMDKAHLIIAMQRKTRS